MKKTLRLFIGVGILSTFLSSCISGGGTLSSYDHDDTWNYLNGRIVAPYDTSKMVGEVVIPSEINGTPITGLSSYFLKGCDKITSIVVPNSITSIAEYAFNGCSGLESISLPFVGAEEDLNETYKAVFGYVFGKEAYEGATQTKQWYMTNTSEHASAAYTSYIPNKLRKITITNDKGLIRGAMSKLANVTEIVLNDEIENIEEKCFDGCTNLQKIKMPSLLFDIKSEAFLDCSSLEELKLGDKVQSIGDKAFKGCTSLKRINSEVNGEFIMPDKIQYIGAYSFSGNTTMTKYVAPFIGISESSLDEGGFFGRIFDNKSSDGTILISFSYNTEALHLNYKANMYIPTGLKNIEITRATRVYRYAFKNMERMPNLESIKINKEAQANVGEDAFNNCGVEPEWI